MGGSLKTKGIEIFEKELENKFKNKTTADYKA